MTDTVQPRLMVPEKPPAAGFGPLGWVRANLFNSIPNSILTLAALLIAAIYLPPLFRWLVIDSNWTAANGVECHKSAGACWAFLGEWYRFILFGRFPYAEQWRPLFVIIIFVFMFLASCDRRLSGRSMASNGAFGLVLRVGSSFVIGLCGMFVLKKIVLTAAPTADSLATIVVYAAPLVIGAAVYPLMGAVASLLGVWLVGAALVLLLMFGGVLGMAYVDTSLWNGLPLTLILAVFGIIFAFPLGIVLALGRRSRMPAVRAVCVAYIELIRGVPLITILFMASVMLPLFLPAGTTIDKLLRAQIGIILFTAAYVAEIIRGGLQAIPKGQFEAADALGLSYWQKTRMIVVPQALSLVIPPLVNTSIGTFKDTSLVLVVGLFDLLNTATASLNDANWRGFYREAYICVALIYWVFCFFMSKYSQALERDLNRSRRR